MRAFFSDKKDKKDKESKDKKSGTASLLCPQIFNKLRSDQPADALAELKIHSDYLPELVSWVDEKSGSTLLHIAAERGSLAVLEILVSCPAVNLNVPDKGGWAPLHSAASAKQLKACFLLIEKGANPDPQNDDKTTPLHYIVRVTPFSDATPLLDVLLKKGVDMEAKNKYGESALQQAAAKVNKDAVQYLLTHRADPNSTNQFGENALHKLARSAGRDPRTLELMQVLVSAGADWHAVGANGSVLDLVEAAARPQVEAALQGTGPNPALSLRASQIRIVPPDSPADISIGVGSTFHISDSTSKMSAMMAQLARKRSSRGLISNESDDVTHSAHDAPPSPGSRSGQRSPNDPPTPESHTAGPPSPATSSSSVSASSLAVLTSKSSRLSVPGCEPLLVSSPSSDGTPRVDGSTPHSHVRDHMTSSHHHSPRTSSCEDIPIRRHNRASSVPDNHSALVRKNTTPLTDTLVLNVEGYRVENGRAGSAVSREHSIDHLHDYYLDNFVVLDKTHPQHSKGGVAQFHKHINFIGAYKTGLSCIVSVLAQPDPVQGYRTIIRTKDGASQVFLPASKITGKLERDAKHLLEEELIMGGVAGATLYLVEDTELHKDLLEYEQNDPQKVRCLPVGVVYAKGEQTLAREMWDNEKHSERFEQFLRVLGDKIQLHGWGGYAGGMDVTYNKKGTHSIYTEYKGFSIMYHVCTLLPFVESDPLKLGRSRVIGNDVVNIIYHEGDVPYHPRTLTGAVTYVFIAVRPRTDEDGNTMYRVACCSKDSVPPFKPELPDQLVTPEELRELLITKVLNGHFAAQRGPGLSKMYSRPREALMEELAIQYVPEIRKQKEKEKEKEREREKELSAKLKKHK